MTDRLNNPHLTIIPGCDRTLCASRLYTFTMRLSFDPLLILLLMLIAGTLAAFLLDATPYPYGIIVLSILVAARVQHLRMRERPPPPGPPS